MRLLYPLLVMLPLVASACNCQADQGPPTPEAAAAKARKQGKPAQRAKPKLPPEPLIGSLRYTWPVTPVAPDDLPALQADVFKAMAGVVEDPASLSEDMPREWKCRRGRFYDVQQPEDAARKGLVRVFERLNTKDCAAGIDATEKWEFLLRYDSEARPKDRKGGGKLPYNLMTQEIVYLGDQQNTEHHLSFKVDSTGKKTKSGPFPHDHAWRQAQVGEGLTLAENPTEVYSQRWGLAQFKVDGERVVVEYEMWRCDPDSDPIGAEVVIRTNRRAPKHTAAKPLDVKAADGVVTVRDQMLEALGERRSTGALNEALAATCKK